MWEILPNNAGLDCFKTPILREILRTQKIYFLRNIVRFWKSHICSNKKGFRSKPQFHTAQQDAGLRLDGFLALDLWDLIVSVLGNTTQTTERPGRPDVCRETNHTQGQQSPGMFNVLDNVDFVLETSNFRIKKLRCLCFKTTKQ